MNGKSRKSLHFTEGASSSPHILLGCDSPTLCDSIHRLIQEAGFQVQLAGDYAEVETLLHRHNHDVVLLDVSAPEAVEAAVQTALRLKRANAAQFVGYLADPHLGASGLTGDAVFPRSPVALPQALHNFFSAAGRE
ncbi:response regulator [Paracidobacterium acidisoli]|nr:response regulator [Paracidobacterium acidisoli]MBT9331264.1 response regulator [Paracidobacterium acidisoli]